MDVKQAKQLQQELERVKSLQDDITKNSARYNKEGKLGVKAQDELNKLLKREKELKENIANLQKKINDEKKKGNQEQKKESDLEKSIGKLLEGRVKKAKELATQNGELASIKTQINVKEQDILKRVKERASAGMSITPIMEKQVDTIESLGLGMNDVAGIMVKQKELEEDQQQNKQELLDTEAQLESAKAVGNTREAQFLEALRDQLTEERNILNNADALLEKRRREANFQKESAKETEFLNTLTFGLAGKVKDVTDEFKNASVKTKLLTISTLSLGAAITVISKVASAFAETIDKIGETFGSLVNLGDGLTTSIVDASTEVTNLGFGVADVTSIVSTLSSEFGVSLDEAANLSAEILDTAKATGLSVDEATKLTGELRIIAGLSQEQSEALIEGTAQLAKQAGVAPQQVLKDIAGSSETIATFTKDSGENLFEAAIQARQLGLSLDTVAKAARSSLEFESSINAELEASALLGTQINLQRARQLALDKDLVGFQNEIKNQLSDIGDFSELNVIQQEALAKSVGMSVNEVAKLVSGTEKLSVAGALSAGTFDDLAGQDALSQLSQLTGQFKELTTTFLNSLGPTLMEIVGDVNKFLANEENIESLKETIKGLADSFKVVGSILGTIIKHTDKIIAGFAAFGVLKFASLAAQLLKINKALTVTALLKQALAGGPLSIAAVVLAVGAGVMAMNAFNKADDLYAGPGGITHMMGPAGSFELNPKDSVLATTNPIPVTKVNEFPAAGALIPGPPQQSDNSDMVAAQRETNNAIEKLGSFLGGFKIRAGRGELIGGFEEAPGGVL